MIFDFSAKGKVMFTMMDHIKRSSKAVQRRSQGLFTLRDQSLAKMLPEEQAMVFHCATAQLLQLLFPRHSTHHCLSNHASE